MSECCVCVLCVCDCVWRKVFGCVCDEREYVCVSERERVFVCVCVCVCE